MKKLTTIIAMGIFLGVMSQCKRENNHDELMTTLLIVLGNNGTVFFQNNAPATRTFSLHSDTCAASNQVGSASVASGGSGSLPHSQLSPFYVGSNVGGAAARCTSSALTMRFPTTLYSCTLSASDVLSCNSL